MSPIVFPVPATEVQITVDEIIGNLTMNQQVELLVKLSNLLANNYEAGVSFNEGALDWTINHLDIEMGNHQ
jgi:hypothetical protein